MIVGKLKALWHSVKRLPLLTGIIRGLVVTLVRWITRGHPWAGPRWILDGIAGMIGVMIGRQSNDTLEARMRKSSGSLTFKVKARFSRDYSLRRILVSIIAVLLLFNEGPLFADPINGGWEKANVEIGGETLQVMTLLSGGIAPGLHLRGKRYMGLGICVMRFNKIVIFAISATQESPLAPVYVLVSESVLISLRTNSETFTFEGIISARDSDFTFTYIGCRDPNLIDLLQRPGTFTMLIEGKDQDWYVKADNIKGGLPKE